MTVNKDSSDDYLRRFRGVEPPGELRAKVVGKIYEESILGIWTLTPTPDSWEAGDREIVCYLYDIELRKLTGSMRGSGV